MKILIVDDDRDVADSLAALVRVVLDYDVCVRYGGESAISAAGEYRPDVVILDVNMPGLNGYATLAKLMQASPEVKVVMISGEYNAARDMRIIQLAVKVYF